MKLTNLTELLEDQLKDLYSAEVQQTKALPLVARRASSEVLRKAISSHLKETHEHVDRLDQIGALLGMKLTGKHCKAMEGLVGEVLQVLELEGSGPVVDAALVASAQRVEHYEISAYGSARALAERLGHEHVAELLQMNLDEEGAADARLTMISLERILPIVVNSLGQLRIADYPIGTT
jgi:ferritin-like metal-binding protein YciE